MAKQKIAIGNAPDDGLGEPLRVAFDKFNDNIDEVFSGANWFRFISRTTTAEPGAPSDGDTYLIASSATGTDWAGQDGKIAIYSTTIDDGNAGWLIFTAPEGAAGWVADEDEAIRYDGTDWLSSPAASQTSEAIGGFIAAPSDKDYRIAVKMPHAGTITETTTVAASGTCTVTFKINTTALGGTANSVSVSEESQAHASANAFAAGDDIVLTISSNASSADLSFMVKYTRVLES